VFADNPKAPPKSPLIKHTIDTGDAKPICQAPYRTSREKQAIIKHEVANMLNTGIIIPSKSPWASPVVIVPKKDGTLRFCVDCRKLNAVTKKDAYPMTRIDDAISILGDNVYFTALDFASGFWQIGMDPHYQEKTAFVTQDGLYEFTRLPFGVVNGPASCQRRADTVLHGLKWKNCLVYVDDIVVFSPNFKQHLVDLAQVLQRLRDANLSLKLSKCRFCCDELPILGFVATREGITTDPTKTKAIDDYPRPSSIDDVLTFLGMAGFYRQFVPQFTILAEPLNRLKKKDVGFRWEQDQENAFQALKKALVSSPVLRHPDFDRPFELHTDAACTKGIGVVLAQRDEATKKAFPIAFASRSLSPAEKNYAVTELEALAIVWAVKKFRPYLEGTFFYCPHRPFRTSLVDGLPRYSWTTG
jgi:hypothetical protein